MPKDFDRILKEALVSKGLVSEEEINSLLRKKNIQENLISLLVKSNLLEEEDCLKALGERLNIPYIKLKQFPVQKEAIEKVPSRIAFYYKFMPLKLRERTLTVAVSYPLDVKIQDEIRAHLGYEIEVVLSCEEEIQEMLKKYYGLGAQTMEKISTPRVEKIKEEKIEDIEELVEDASVVRLVNEIILDAYKKRATDIHIEPYRDSVSIRYRIDGVLYEAEVNPQIRDFFLPIISRIKIMCNLNIVERRLPQDGRAIVKTQEQTLDLRISTLPTPFGESVVIRILPVKMLFSLEKLGLLEEDLKILEDLIKKSYGIIFITGPTGSGKTTTLYACLSKINTRDKKIITIEDPIEYEMKGITQVQVMPEIGFSFARGLRSILRHDPDVIMVGEVRDLETAEIAIRVALTGHLVLSTLHTKDAASGVTRLLDIGIEPYLLSSSVEAFIAQRLVRVICPHCKEPDIEIPYQLKERIISELGLPSEKEVTIFKGRGCQECNFTGFLGRTGIYEILLVDDSIGELILRRATSTEIKKVAISRGMHTLHQDGWRKVLLGVTTPQEIVRVVSSQDINVLEGTKKFSLSPSQEDKRIYPRISSKVNLRYKVIKTPEGKLLSPSEEKFNLTDNISAGGLAFFSSQHLNPGTILQLKVELPDGNPPMESLVKVVWTKEIPSGEGYEIGVCFLDLTGSERARLTKYVEEEKF